MKTLEAFITFINQHPETLSEVVMKAEVLAWLKGESLAVVLYYASALGRGDIVNSILHTTPKTQLLQLFNFRDQDGATIFMAAAKMGHHTILQNLLSLLSSQEAFHFLNIADDKVGGTALLYATTFGHLDALQTIKQAVAPSDFFTLVSAQDHLGFTPLMLAAYTGNIYVTYHILQGLSPPQVQALISATNSNNQTTQMIAEEKHYLDVAQMITEKAEEVGAVVSQTRVAPVPQKSIRIPSPLEEKQRELHFAPQATRQKNKTPESTPDVAEKTKPKMDKKR